MTHSNVAWSWSGSTTPTPQFVAVVEAMQVLLEDIQSVLQEVVREADSRYEAIVAACAQTHLCLTFAWTVPDLARLGLQTFAPACSSARGALEVAAKAAWLLQPDEAMSREGRWLGWYESLERFYQNLASDFVAIPDVAGKLKRTSDHYRTYRTTIAEKLPASCNVVRPGSFEAILQALNLAGLYPLYRFTSQYHHPGLSSCAVRDLRSSRSSHLSD